MAVVLVAVTGLCSIIFSGRPSGFFAATSARATATTSARAIAANSVRANAASAGVIVKSSPEIKYYFLCQVLGIFLVSLGCSLSIVFAFSSKSHLVGSKSLCFPKSSEPGIGSSSFLSEPLTRELRSIAAQDAARRASLKIYIVVGSFFFNYNLG